MVVGTARAMGLQIVEDAIPPEPIRVELWEGKTMIVQYECLDMNFNLNNNFTS